MNDWVLYILECADQTLYTGITNDLDKRLFHHQTGNGAKYTRGRGPFTIVYTEYHVSRAAAARRESEIKKYTKARKQALYQK